MVGGNTHWRACETIALRGVSVRVDTLGSSAHTCPLVGRETVIYILIGMGATSWS